MCVFSQNRVSIRENNALRRAKVLGIDVKKISKTCEEQRRQKIAQILDNDRKWVAQGVPKSVQDRKMSEKTASKKVSKMK